MTSKKGFTMVELLIVLAIIAILAAVAIPVYSSQLENARKEVDNSNLRAATGLAAQDYILRNSGRVVAEKAESYVVLTYESTSNGAVNSQNMLVYPADGVVDSEGTWYAGSNSNTGSKNKVLTIPADSGLSGAVNTIAITTTSTGLINSRKVKALPLQQNSGNARFIINIDKGGVVAQSRIVTGVKITVDGK